MSQPVLLLPGRAVGPSRSYLGGSGNPSGRCTIVRDIDGFAATAA